MNTLADIVRSEFATNEAIVIPDGGPRLTYAAFNDQVGQLQQQLLRGGVKPGDAISIVLPNGLEYLSTFLAVTWARAIAAPLNPAYTVDEFLFYMEDSESTAVILPPGDHLAREAAARLGLPVWSVQLGRNGEVDLEIPEVGGAGSTAVAPEPDDVALFLHTSGTTSRPKGVPLRHSNLVASLRNIVGTYQLNPDDTSMVVMPLFHVHGLMGSTLSTLSSGGTVVIPPGFSASRFWPHVEAHGPTWYSAVPTIHQILLNRADQDGALSGKFRFIRSCSSALAPAVMRRIEERFGASVLEAYAMTEASHQMSSNPLPPGIRKPGTVGKPTGIEMTMLDEAGHEVPQGELGEVSIKGPNVTFGYHKNPEANAEAFTNGWFRTGDQGFFDEAGYVQLTGRIKELINRGGEKISPLEVDAVLLDHPMVVEAVAFAVPDDIYSEEVEAAVVVNGAVEANEIIRFCCDHLAEFKSPKHIHIAQELPRTATGKIQRRHVAAHFHPH